ncbi:unnamed protein product [Protopolystoma xenopodis]|uniref:Uncharacterized protein n=1 Tax=Protopolystoma xenopodis TaxID=117903 RepID=A0A3S5A442_9PLAT|nr:unnamed protein product [Protopolystoma xenopodis]
MTAIQISGQSGSDWRTATPTEQPIDAEGYSIRPDNVWSNDQTVSRRNRAAIPLNSFASDGVAGQDITGESQTCRRRRQAHTAFESKSSEVEDDYDGDDDKEDKNDNDSESSDDPSENTFQGIKACYLDELLLLKI